MRRQSRPEPATPESEAAASVDVDTIASADFALVRKGFEPDAVRAFRDRVVEDLRRGRAEVEAALLEVERLRRELDEVRAEEASEPHTDEAIAILGDDATRIIQAAQQSSKEIVAAAEAAAEDIRAKARDDAGRIAEETRRESEDFGGRLSGQADEVRAKLRDEIRRARIDFAEEADRLRAEARYEAEAIVEQAREDAQLLRAEAEATASERQDQGATLLAERIASAEAAAEVRVAAAVERAQAITADAEAARDGVLAELQANREALETHLRALQDVQIRARSDIGAAQTMLAAVASELGRIRLREVEVPPLALDLEIPSPSPAGASEEEGDSVESGPAPVDEDEGEGEGGAEVEVEVEVEDDPAAAEAVSADTGDDEAIEAIVDEVGEPSDDEIDALFERVVAHRGSENVTQAQAEPAIAAAGAGAEDDGDWGYDDDAVDYPDLAQVSGESDVSAVPDVADVAVGSPDGAEPTETRRRVFAALHQLAVDTGEVPVATAPGDATASGNGSADTAAVEEEEAAGQAPEPTDDSEALDLVPAVTRKVKRALQEVENAVLDADLDGADIDVITVFAEYLVPSAVEAMQLGLGTEAGVGLEDDAEVVVRVVCGAWADELGAGLTGADAAAVTIVVGDARAGAEEIAADLARTAFRAGRERAARSPR